MEFSEIQESLEIEQAKVKPKKTGQISANEKKLIELEGAIENELKDAPINRKGCFGKLVRLAQSQVCKACVFGIECEIELLKNGVSQMLQAEAEVEAIVADNELKTELVNIKMTKPTGTEAMAHPILKQIYDAAETAKAALKPESDPIAEVVEKVVNKPAPEKVKAIDLSALGANTRVPFDFNAAKDVILTEQPKDWKRIREICLGMVDDTFLHGATAYRNAKKIMAQLSTMKIVGWDTEKLEITYSL